MRLWSFAIACLITGCWTADPPAPAPPKQPEAAAPVTKKRVPKPRDDYADSVAMLERFRDDFCACTDVPCVERVSVALQKWSQEQAPKSDRKPTPDETQRMTEITRQLADCMSKAMSHP